MTSNAKLWCGVVVAIVIAAIGCLTPGARQAAPATNGPSESIGAYGNILDTFTGDYFSATTGFQLGTSRSGFLNTGGGVITCGASTTVAVISSSVPATCNVVGASASSTVIAIGPFTASSTLTNLIVSGIASSATTTDLLVATSTLPSPAAPVATSTLAENVMGLFSLTAATQFYSIAGVTMGSGRGYASAAGGTYRSNLSVGIGVGDYVLVFSTSTSLTGATNGGINSSQVAVPANITVKYEVQY